MSYQFTSFYCPVKNFFARRLVPGIVALALLAGCQSGRTVTFVHINDVYEITPLANGTEGGLARVAHISKKLKKRTLKVPTSFWPEIF